MVTLSLDVKPDCIVSFLKRELQFRDLCQQILYREIIDAAAQERGITVSDEEIQEEANQFRYQRKLESAAATFTWLDEQLITSEEWQEGIRDRLLAKKLSEALFEKDIPTYFAQNNSPSA
jgi:FKBP-type peptidyl-prolyl cis-trans isomerase (trigger factor)